MASLRVNFIPKTLSGGAGFEPAIYTTRNLASSFHSQSALPFKAGKRSDSEPCYQDLERVMLSH